MTTPVFSVIIPVYNKWELTRNCLQSLRERTPEYDFEVIVVDNASKDATATELQPFGESLFGQRFRRIRFEENRNFGPACNAGAEAAAAPLVFFLNNDTLMTDGWAPPLVQALEDDPALGAVGPLLLYEDGTVQHLGVVMTASSFSHLYRGFPAEHPVVRRRRQLQALTGAALLMPKEFFMQCGGFFEGYRNGFEDVELSLRIRQRGRTLTCVPESVVYHLESQTFGRKQYEAENSALVAERCASLYYTDLHHYALQDGFSVFINDFFEIGVRLNMEEENALAKEAGDKPASEWLRLTRKHPYWVHGREVLAAALEKEGKYVEALELRANLANIVSSEENFKKLMRVAILAGNAVTQAKTEKFLKMLLTCKQDRVVASAVMQKALARMKDGNDPLLDGLYREKLRKMHS